MRKLLLAGIIALFIIGCKKDSSTGNSINITGSWEYRGTSCFCAPPTDTNAYKPGNGTIYNFAASTYKYYVKHVLKKSGTYKVFKEKVASSSEPFNRIVFDNDYNTDAKYIRLNNNKFSIGGEIGSVADAPEDHYEKQLTAFVENKKISN
jgi:hypothetical protein